MDWMTITPFASLGVGGLLALTVMSWKRKDDRQHAECIVQMSKDATHRIATLADEAHDLTCRVTEALIENKAEMTKHNSCIQANTKAMDRLSSVIDNVLRETVTRTE